MDDFNFWAVILASVASFAFGALWYSPLLFMEAWCREAGVDMKGGIANPGKVYGLTFASTFVTALTLAVWLRPYPELLEAVSTGFMAGVGFVAMSLGINYQFAGRSSLLWAIDAGFHIIRLSLMGLVIGLMA